MGGIFMKANVLTVREKKAAEYVARRLIDKNIEAATKRVQYMWIAAMVNCGFDKADILRVADALNEVTEKYGDYRKDGCADYALMRDLKAAGIDLGPICDPRDEI
jgi:hypothetical protein